VLAWTGQSDPEFRTAIWLTALAGLFKAVSLLQLILYRATGKALFDNIRQVLRIMVILCVAFLHTFLGFTGVLWGMAVAELVGVIFMFFAMKSTFRGFSIKILTGDTIRIFVATSIVIVAGMLASTLPIPWKTSDRLLAFLKLGLIGAGCLAAMWPSLVFSKTLSLEERKSLMNVVLPGKKKALATNG
jgi:hypothetical protein